MPPRGNDADSGRQTYSKSKIYIVKTCFFFSIVTNKNVSFHCDQHKCQNHSLRNNNNGDLFEAGHNLEGWISTADQRLLLRKHTTWNSNKRADGDLTQSHPIVFSVQSNSGGQKILVKSGIIYKWGGGSAVWEFSLRNPLESHIFTKYCFPNLY